MSAAADGTDPSKVPFWQPGDTVLWRYTRPGHDVESLRPMRVVRDDADGLVAWLPSGTPLLRPVLGNGDELRSVPLTERFDVDRHGRANRLGTWRGHGLLKVAPAGAPWSVWVFWGDDGEFRGWYVNLEAVHRRGPVEVVSEDHVLDVVVLPDRSTVRKDEDELAAAVVARRFTDVQEQQIEADAAAVEQLVRDWGPPFCDGWEAFAPDPAWPRPDLPSEHLQRAAYC